MSIMETAKAHPVAAVGVLALGLLVLYLLLSGGNATQASASAQGPSENMQIAELQAATGLGAAQIQAAAADKHDEATIRLAELGYQASLLGKYDDNNTAIKINNTQATLAAHQTELNYNLNTKIADITGAVQLAGIDSATASRLAEVQQVTDIARVGAGVNLASISAGRDVALGGQRSSVDIANAGYNAATKQVDINAGVARKQSGDNVWNNVIKGATSLIGGLFSFL